MTRALVAIFALLPCGCVMRRPPPPGVAPAGAPLRFPEASSARPLLEGEVARFPAEWGSVAVDLSTGVARREPAPADARRGLSVKDAGASKRLFAISSGGGETALSSESESVTGFDAAPYPSPAGASCVAWCGRAGADVAVRGAIVDPGAPGPRASRVPFDPSWPFAAAPSTSAIGRPEESAFVVAYEAAARADAPPQVRIARFVAGADGALRCGAPKPAAFRFASSRAPAVAAAGAVGLLAFEGSPRGEEPGLFVVPLDALGDVQGDPVLLAPAREDRTERSRPVPFRGAGRWHVAWEETTRGKRELVVQPLRVE